MLQEKSNPLSAVLITYNEAQNIGPTLERLQWCDEILVVDSGSTDQTKAIAEQLGARVIEHAFEGFGQQKQFAIEQAVNDWVLSVDADEWVSEELATAIQQLLKEKSGDMTAAEVARKTVYLGKRLRYGPSIGDNLVRLFDRRKASFTDAKVHEQVAVKEGKVLKLKGDLLHFPYASVHHHLEKMNYYTTVAARQGFERGKRTGRWGIPFRAIMGFKKFYFFKLGFLDGFAGLAWAVFTGYYRFLKYVKLYELQKRKDS